MRMAEDPPLKASTVAQMPISQLPKKMQRYYAAMALKRNHLARRTSLLYDTPRPGGARQYLLFLVQWRSLALVARRNDAVGCMDLATGAFRTMIIRYLLPPEVCMQYLPRWPGEGPARPRPLVKRTWRERAVGG